MLTWWEAQREASDAAASADPPRGAGGGAGATGGDDRGLAPEADPGEPSCRVEEDDDSDRSIEGKLQEPRRRGDKTGLSIKSTKFQNQNVAHYKTNESVLSIPNITAILGSGRQSSPKSPKQ